MSQRDPGSVARELVLLGIGVFVTLVWGIAVMVQVVSPAHVVPTEVHGVMLVIAGGFFAGGAIAGAKRKAENGS